MWIVLNVKFVAAWIRNKEYSIHWPQMPPYMLSQHFSEWFFLIGCVLVVMEICTASLVLPPLAAKMKLIDTDKTLHHESWLPHYSFDAL